MHAAMHQPRGYQPTIADQLSALSGQQQVARERKDEALARQQRAANELDHHVNAANALQEKKDELQKRIAELRDQKRECEGTLTHQKDLIKQQRHEKGSKSKKTRQSGKTNSGTRQQNARKDAEDEVFL